MNNVVQHQTVVWSELKQWCDKEQTSAAEARACWPEIAARMARLRKDYPSDIEFGAALVMHGIEYGKNDRAAFIWMGGLKPSVLEDAMARCDRRSPRHFKSEVLSWGDEYFDQVSPRGETSDPTPTSEPEEAPVQPNPQESAPAEVSDDAKSEQAGRSTEPLDRRQVLVQKLPEAPARILLAHFSNPVTRQMLAKVVKPVLLELAALCESGRLGEGNGSNMNKFSARVLVPELPREWTRGRTFRPVETKAVKSIMADTDRFIAMREAGCSTKAECDRWWAENVTRRKAVDVTASATSQPAGTAQASPIVVHGKQIWPRPSYVRDADQYTRGTAVAMFHLWQDLNRALSVSEQSHVGRARVIANLAKWIRDGANYQAGVMLQEMAFNQQSDEKGTLETSRLTFVNGDQVGG